MAAAVPPSELESSASATPSHSPTLSPPRWPQITPRLGSVGRPQKDTRRDNHVAPCLHINRSFWQQVSADRKPLPYSISLRNLFDFGRPCASRPASARL